MTKKILSKVARWTGNIVIALLLFVLAFLIAQCVKHHNDMKKAPVPNQAVVVSEVSSTSACVEEFFNNMMAEFKNFTDEESYAAYEEELPQNIIVEQPSSKHPYVSVDPIRRKGQAPMIAIVIDDMGISKKRTRDINSLRYPITSSFLTYGTDLKEQMGDSSGAGHEVMAHIPMEAGTDANVAPDVLRTSMSDRVVEARLNNMIDKFGKIKGINNHMGSKFTEDLHKMGDVMDVLKSRDLFFLDSRTSEKSAGGKAAEYAGVRYATRNIFLDNTNELNYILAQLRATEKIAAKKGYAIAIGHPKSQTYLALRQWLPTVKGRGFKLVHLSEIVALLNKPAEQVVAKH